MDLRAKEWSGAALEATAPGLEAKRMDRSGRKDQVYRDLLKTPALRAGAPALADIEADGHDCRPAQLAT